MQQQKPKIVAILGSTRLQSVNRIILTGLKQRYADVADIEIFDGLAALPHFNPDLLDNSLPDAVAHLYQLIENAQGVLICSPEYVFSLPGALKNALEWTVSTTLFSNKPSAIIVASSLGEKAFESLGLIMNMLGVKMPEASTLLISGSNSKVSGAGNSLHPGVIAQLDSLMASFIGTIN